MSPRMMLLAFMLPLLTATQFLDANDLYTFFPTFPKGDIFNVTQCYCQRDNTTFGYYDLYSYWNNHLSRSYSISVNGTFSAAHTSNGTKPDCKTFDDGNEFCYKSNEDVDDVNHTKPSGLIRFNGQKTVVPGQANDVLTPDQAMQNCGTLCYGELELYTSLNPEGPFVGRVGNRIASYTDLDDVPPLVARLRGHGVEGTGS